MSLYFAPRYGRWLFFRSRPWVRRRVLSPKRFYIPRSSGLLRRGKFVDYLDNLWSD